MLYLVLPAYNEAENVATLLTDICAVLHEMLPNTPVAAVLVDDGSSDGTASIAEATAADLRQRFPVHNFRLHTIRHEGNKGLAEGLKSGLLYCCDVASDKDIVVTMDCDNSHTPGLVPRLFRAIMEGYDVVVASRFRPDARVVGLTWQRIILSQVASAIFRAILPIPGIRDYTCGFRAYRGEVVKRAMKDSARLMSEAGFSVMVDVLLKIHHQDPNLAFGEIPLLLRYDRKQGVSKMKVRDTIFRTLRLIVRRRLGDWS